MNYESGIDSVPRFDAHIEIYGQDKTIRIQWDTPFVKGLPVTLNVCENVNNGYRETQIRRTYEDPYTLELKAFHALVVNGTPVKTTAEDARNDTIIFQMIMRSSLNPV